VFPNLLKSQLGAAAGRNDAGAEPDSPAAAVRQVLPDPLLVGAGAGAAGGRPGGRLYLPPAEEQPVQLPLPE
jgi:hypothetical protein